MVLTSKGMIVLVIYILWRNIDIDKYELLQNGCYIVLSDSPSNFYTKDFKQNLSLKKYPSNLLDYAWMWLKWIPQNSHVLETWSPAYNVKKWRGF